jgi:hypothetical protein
MTGELKGFEKYLQFDKPIIKKANRLKAKGKTDFNKGSASFLEDR